MRGLSFDYYSFDSKTTKMIHDHGYWTSKEETNTHACDKALSNALIDVFGDVGWVVDIGCGDGSYTNNFLDHGIPCVGYDGSPLTHDLTNGVCFTKDFAIPQDIGQFDLVLSLEVGEHIPQEFEQVFLNNICKASKKYVCLSWAIVGQGGTGHVNCQNNDHVIRFMRSRNFEFDVELSRKLRQLSSFPWFKNTLMVFTYNLQSI